MKKVELINLNNALQGLVTPSMSPERGIVWLKGVLAIKKAAEGVQEEIQAGIDMPEKSEAEKNELINLLVQEEVHVPLFQTTEDEIMQVMAANPNKTMGERIFIIDTLS